MDALSYTELILYTTKRQLVTSGDSMIQEDILRVIRHGVCAIGWLSVTPEEQFKAPMRPFFQIAGLATRPTE
jgi:hypothetical protein